MDVNYPAAVLAGGLGTRLWPRTAAVPKVLVETAGYPFLHHVLRMLARRGFERIVLCVGHLGSQVEDYVGDGSDIGLDVSYSHDSPSRPGSALGTATALRGALLQLRSPCFWAINGDTYLDVDYGEVEHLYIRNRMRNLAIVCRAETVETGNVRLDGGRIIEYSKTRSSEEFQYVEAGATILDRRALLSGPAPISYRVQASRRVWIRTPG